jgi:hypothetical protein
MIEIDTAKWRAASALMPSNEPPGGVSPDISDTDSLVGCLPENSWRRDADKGDIDGTQSVGFPGQPAPTEPS